MSQLVALSLNQKERVGCTLGLHAADLVLPPVAAGLVGLGYYDSGELLSRVSPRVPGAALAIAAELAELEADVLVLHAGAAADAEGAGRDDAQPFRFQEWLMARTGELAGFADYRASVLDAMPPFIRRGLSGDTADEHFFHLFLAFLFDAGRIGHANVGTPEIRRALCQAVAAFDAFGEAAGHAPAAFAAVVSDGYSLVAAARGVDARYALVEGIRACGECRTSRASGDGGGIDHDGLRGVLIAAGLGGPVPPRFRALEDGGVLSVTSDTRIELHTLAQVTGR